MRQPPRPRQQVAAAGPFVRVLERLARERDVVLMEVDGNPQLPASPLGKADVVEMGMGEDDCADLRGVATDLGQDAVQRVP